MIANENTRARGKEVKNCRCSERQRAKARGCRSLGEWGKGVPKEREIERRREVCEWEG
jgi:hypothetical protein